MIGSQSRSFGPGGVPHRNSPASALAKPRQILRIRYEGLSGKSHEDQTAAAPRVGDRFDSATEGTKSSALLRLETGQTGTPGKVILESLFYRPSRNVR